MLRGAVAATASRRTLLPFRPELLVGAGAAVGNVDLVHGGCSAPTAAYARALTVVCVVGFSAEGVIRAANRGALGRRAAILETVYNRKYSRNVGGRDRTPNQDDEC